MLRSDVRDAADKGDFRVYAVSHVDEAMEVLTGVPVATINERVSARLADFAEKRRQEKGGEDSEAKD